MILQVDPVFAQSAGAGNVVQAISLEGSQHHEHHIPALAALRYSIIDDAEARQEPTASHLTSSSEMSFDRPI